MTDRNTKVLLGLVAVALWIIVLRPLLPAHDASAQSQGTAPGQKSLKARYEFLDVEQGGTTGIYQLKDKLDGMAARGWRVNSVAVTTDATVIVLEKLE